MNSMAIARNIRKKMDEWSATEKSVATMMGVTERCVNNWTNGRRQPTAYAILRLSRLFACSMEDLMEGIDEPTTAQENAKDKRNRSKKHPISGEKMG